MYKMNKYRDAIIRISDNKQAAPCDSAEDIDFLTYKSWVEQGNQPAYADDDEQQ